MCSLTNTKWCEPHSDQINEDKTFEHILDDVVHENKEVKSLKEELKKQLKLT